MFECLDSRYVVKGDLRLLGPLAVSTGEANEYTDLPVMKTLEGTPFIPGSSFRGALRATAERILYSLGKPVCLLGANPDVKDCREQDKQINAMVENGMNELEVLQEVLDRLCPACRIFGATTLASRLKVSDLLFIRNGAEPPPVTLRHRVAIDRDRETAKEGAKFDNEVVESGSFSMELIIENAEDKDWGILGIGLLELLEGNFWVGGDRAVGAGRCQLVNPKIFFFERGGTATLLHFLTASETGLKRYPGKFEDGEAVTYILKKVREFLKESEDASGKDKPV